ncbi:unnamed protein product [Linum tenue]|uniref:Uncharacterized protein n=1 Tax=Linum tenue TaxID=586396 RepID=A0AAV0QC60_9ROSI|nr:unnamed protein product [Linum tenue]
MGKLMGFGKVFDRLCLSPSPPNSNSCFCANSLEAHDDGDDYGEVFEQKEPLMMMGSTIEKSNRVVRLKDVVSVNPNQTLAFQIKPKMVVLRVSMHCGGCAKKKKNMQNRRRNLQIRRPLSSNGGDVVGDGVPDADLTGRFLLVSSEEEKKENRSRGRRR